MAVLTHVDLGPREQWAAVPATKGILAFIYGAAVLVCLYWLVGAGVAGWIVSRGDFRLPVDTPLLDSGCVTPLLGEPVCPVQGWGDRKK